MSVLRFTSHLTNATLQTTTRLSFVLDGHKHLLRLGHAMRKKVEAYLQQHSLFSRVHSFFCPNNYQFLAQRIIRARNVQPVIARLLRFLLLIFQSPFKIKNTGVDLFGLIHLVEGRKIDQHYDIMLTCLDTRTCQLGSFTGLTSDNFMDRFRRFITSTTVGVLWSCNSLAAIFSVEDAMRYSNDWKEDQNTCS